MAANGISLNALSTEEKKKKKILLTLPKNKAM